MRRINIALALLLSGCLPTSLAQRVAAIESGPLLAGASAIDISPLTLPALANGGFLQRTADHIDDPLFARALVLSNQEETIAIVVIDSCMLTTEVCDSIKEMAVKQTGIRSDRILISATHTHSAPSAMDMCLGCAADDAYVDFLPEQAATAIANAHKNLQPAKLGWAIIDGSDLTNCRRWITRSDRMGTDPFGGQTIRAMMHPGYQNTDYTSPAGPIDPWLSVLSVVAADDEAPICVMGNLSMHYFGAGDGFSADYFGDVTRLLDKSIGQQRSSTSPAFVGIMSQGTSGDLHWMDYSQPQRNTNRQQYATAVADRVLQAMQGITYSSDLPLAMAEKRIVIARRTPSLERREWARPINAARGDIPARNLPEVYAQQAEWIHEHPTAEVVLQALRIGELGITAMPTETYGITGLKLKRQSPLSTTINLELSNGAVGYIPPPEQHRLGGYTTWPARTACLAEDAEPQIVETLLGLLESVSSSDRRELAEPMTAYSQAVAAKQPVAYYRFEEMTSGQVRDSVGINHGYHRGGVALFLPGVDVTPFQATEFGNRAAYLAGGHIEVGFETAREDLSLSICLNNMLPTDARDTTGILIATEGWTLSIAGNLVADKIGRLVLSVGDQTHTGRTPMSIGQWQQVTVTRAGQHLCVYLDGRVEPEIEAHIESPQAIQQLWIGSDGNSSVSFDGKVDEVAVFDRELTATEVAELYDASGLTPPILPKATVKLGPKPTDATSRSQYSDAIALSKPMAYWRLHDSLAPTASDTAGQHHARYETGANSLPDDAVQQNFTGGRVQARVPGLGKTYSVECWFRNELPVDARPVTGYLFSRAIDGEDGANGDNLGLGGTHSNSGRLFVFNGNSRDQLVAGTTRIAIGSWSHVVMVRDQQHITLYLNGDPEPEIDADLPITFRDECEDIFLGGRADNFANLQGMLEEVALYDRALTPGEVQTHFQAAAAVPIQNTTQAHIDVIETPTPMSIEQSLDTIHVRQGYEVQLVAAEPLIMDPVAIDWGPDGKLWVVEMADYPLGIDGQGKPGGRVRYLEDSNQDGQYDKSTLFAEQLSFPNGVMAWGRGVLVTAAPEIVYLEDTTGDGKADVRRILYSGFLEGNQQLRVNGLRWGLDNWVYCASGSHHGGYGQDSLITSHLTGEQHRIGSRDFRIRPHTGQLDPQSGPSQYGRNRDDWGNWFGVQNSYPLWHYVLADHHIRRNPHFAPPDPKHQVVTPANPPVFPASKLEKRFHSFEESGRFTSACSAMIYRDNYLFSRSTEQHAFTCEPFHNLIQHNVIVADGVSFSSHRDPAEQDIDFFASQDRWCRPVMVRTGPDGCLWVVDMYRYMIEHPEWLPSNGKEELRPWYRAGEDRGRIYRIVRSDQAPRPIPRLDTRSSVELVAALESPNGWQRDTAQRLLVESQQANTPDAISSALLAMLHDSQEPLARLHAMWTLVGRDALPTDALASMLNDSHPGVRRNAMQIAADKKVDINQLASLIRDADPKLRLELATTLRSYNSLKASELLANLVTHSHQEPYIVAAVMSSLNSANVLEVLSAAMKSTDGTESAILNELMGQAIALSAPADVARLITTSVETLAPHDSGADRKQQLAMLAQILDGIENRPDIREKLSERAQASIEATIHLARNIASDNTENADVRATAVRLLGRTTKQLDSDLQLMQELLVPQTPGEVQSEIVGTLARSDEPQIANILLSGWRSHSPQLRTQILEILPSRAAWAETLRENLIAGIVLPSDLSVAIQQRLLQSSENNPEWQAALAVRVSSDRATVVHEMQSALELEGSLETGEVIFRKICASCHQVGNEGYDVGPQLVSITDKSASTLLTSILDPNASIDGKYYNYAAITADGRTLTGRLETETSSSITLLTAGGKRETILRRDIEELKSTAKSVMPEGLEQGLTPQDMADLIQFVRNRFR